MTRYHPFSRTYLPGERVEYRVKLGLERDHCGRVVQRVRPTGGEVLAVDPGRDRAWVLLDGETVPRLIEQAKLATDPHPPKKRCGC